MDLLMIGNRFHHEVWAVADISICAKKHRPNADSQNEIIETGVAEQKSDLYFFDANFAPRQVRGTVFLEGRKRIADCFGVRSSDAGKIDIVVHQLLNLVDNLLIDKQSKTGA